MVSRALLEPSCVLRALVPGPLWSLCGLHSAECFVAYQCRWQHRCCTPRSRCCSPKRSRVGGCPQQRRSCRAAVARVCRSKEVVRTKCQSRECLAEPLCVIVDPCGCGETDPPQLAALLLWQLTRVPPCAACHLDKGTLWHRSGHASDLRVRPLGHSAMMGVCQRRKGKSWAHMRQMPAVTAPLPVPFPGTGWS